MISNTVCPTEDMDIDIEFVKSLRSYLYKKDPAIYTLKRALGRQLDDDIRAYLAFLSVSGGQFINSKEDIYFLVACLFYNIERAGEENKDKKYVRIEELIGRMYKNKDTSDSTRRQIDALFYQTYSKTGAFVPQLTRIVNRAVKNLKPSETINYAGFIKDLCFWNHKNKSVQKKWGKTIMLYNTKETTNDSEEKEI